VLAVPAGVALSWYSDQVTLPQSGVSAAVGFLLGLGAILLSRRGQEQVQRTLGRSGGAATARIGRMLGVLGICVAITAGLALGFFGLLTLFAD
jgi:hypothetical protein